MRKRKSVIRGLALAAVLLLLPLNSPAEADCIDNCMVVFWANYDWCMATVGASGYCIAVGWEAERNCLGGCNNQFQQTINQKEARENRAKQVLPDSEARIARE